VLLVTLDKFDPNLVLVNVNTLKPYQFLDEEAHTTNRPKLMYWEGQKGIKMDDKEDEHLDEYVFMLQMEPIDGTFMQHMTYVPMKVKLDDKHLG
jgi:hypothetical protein